MKPNLPLWMSLASIMSGSGFVTPDAMPATLSSGTKDANIMIDSRTIPNRIGYATSSTERMLMLETALQSLAVANAREKLKESAKDKLKEAAKDKLKELVEDKANEVRIGVKEKAKKRLLGRLKERAIEMIKRFIIKRIKDRALQELIERRNGLDILLMSKVVGLNITNSSATVLEDLSDPSLNLFLAVAPSAIIDANDDAHDNRDIELYNEQGDEQTKFKLGWEKCGDKGFYDWEKKFVPATSIELAEGLTLKKIREDAFTGPPSPAQTILLEFSKSGVLYPLEDKITYFRDQKQADQLIEDVKLQSQKHGGAFPNTYGKWSKGDQNSDEFLSRFFFHGLGAVLLEKQRGESGHPELGPIEINMDFMADFAVRDGFRPYGATIYFDTKQRVKGIYDTAKKLLLKPGDEGWEAAKFLAKSTAFTLINGREHFLDTHLIASNYMAFSTIKHLLPSHPIRRLMNIFTYNANSVNDNVLRILTAEKGIYHRSTAFKYSALTKFFKHGTEVSNIFEPFPKRKIIHELEDQSKRGKLHYHKDGCQYYEIVEKFVRKWLVASGESANDEYAKTFYNEIRDASMGSGYELPEFDSKDSMVDLLSQYIFVVTAYHEISGTTSMYRDSPYTLSSRVVDSEEGFTEADVQSFMFGRVTSATQGTKVPKLMKPYRNYFGKDGAPKWERKEWGRFLFDCRNQSFKISSENNRLLKRNPEFRFFNPKHFKSSASV